MQSNTPKSQLTIAFKNLHVYEIIKKSVNLRCRERFNGRGEAVSDKFAELFLNRNKLSHPSRSFISKLIAEAEREVDRKIKPRGTTSIDDDCHPVEITDNTIDEDQIIEVIDRKERIREIYLKHGQEAAVIVRLLIQKYTIAEISQMLKTPKGAIRKMLGILTQDQEQESHSG